MNEFEEKSTHKSIKELNGPMVQESPLDKAIQKLNKHNSGLIEKISWNKVLEDELLEKYPELAEQYYETVRKIKLGKILKIANEQLITNVKEFR